MDEGNLFLAGKLLVDEVDEVGGERGVGKRRAEDPLFTLRGLTLWAVPEITICGVSLC